MWDRKDNRIPLQVDNAGVLSELCGIESRENRIYGLLSFQVLSELCGIESVRRRYRGIQAKVFCLNYVG